jgi:hypothetical protein
MTHAPDRTIARPRLVHRESRPLTLDCCCSRWHDATAHAEPLPAADRVHETRVANHLGLQQVVRNHPDLIGGQRCGVRARPQPQLSHVDPLVSQSSRIPHEGGAAGASNATARRVSPSTPRLCCATVVLMAREVLVRKHPTVDLKTSPCTTSLALSFPTEHRHPAWGAIRRSRGRMGSSLSREAPVTQRSLITSISRRPSRSSLL